MPEEHIYWIILETSVIEEFQAENDEAAKEEFKRWLFATNNLQAYVLVRRLCSAQLQISTEVALRG